MSDLLMETELCISVDVGAIGKRIADAGIMFEYFDDSEYCVPRSWRRSDTKYHAAGYMNVDGETERAWLYVYPAHPYWEGASLQEVEARARAEWHYSFEAEMAEQIKETDSE